MKKIHFHIISGLFLLIALSQNLNAQNTVLYGMKNLPQYNYDNPARQPNCKTYVGFPALSSIMFNARFSGLSYDDIIRPHPTNGSFFVDIDNIENSLGEKNLMGFENHISIPEFGFSLGRGQYVSFSAQNKTRQYFSFPKSILEIRRGNYKEDGSPIVFNLHEQLVNYNEYAIGYSKRFFNRLTIGARLKLLSGNLHFQTNNLNIEWHTGTAETELYPWTWTTDINMNAAALAEWKIIYDDNGQFEDIEFDEEMGNIKPSSFALSKNIGFGIDAGADYRMFDWLNLSAAVSDFGFIQWKTYAQTLEQSTEFTFTGLDIGAYFNGLEDLENQNIIDSLITELGDSLINEFNPSVTEGAYTSYLHTKFTASAEFYTTKWLHFGLLYRGIMINKDLYSSFAVSANANFWRGFSLSANYSVANRAYNNIGVGFAYKLGPLQMYFITDNIAPALYMWDQEFTKNYMYKTKSVNLHFGINFVFCNEKYDQGLMF